MPGNRPKGQPVPKNKTYRPKSGKEGMTLSQSLADRDKAFVVKSWPHSTEDAGEQAVLDAHPWVTDAPAPKSSTQKKEDS